MQKGEPTAVKKIEALASGLAPARRKWSKPAYPLMSRSRQLQKLPEEKLVTIFAGVRRTTKAKLDNLTTAQGGRRLGAVIDSLVSPL